MIKLIKPWAIYCQCTWFCLLGVKEPSSGSVEVADTRAEVVIRHREGPSVWLGAAVMSLLYPLLT